jgi:hypothetical protein
MTNEFVQEGVRQPPEQVEPRVVPKSLVLLVATALIGLAAIGLLIVRFRARKK